MTGIASAARGAALLASICVLALVGTAAAHVLSTPTNVFIDKGGPSGANGKVGSARAFCRSGRTVQLLKGNQVIGSDVTNSAGEWKISEPLTKGVYVAKAKRKNKHFRRNGKLHKHDCAEGRSAHTPL